MYPRSLVIFAFSSLVLLTSSSESSYDYFKLAQQWPATYCMSKMNTSYPCIVSPIPDEFKIHGLWPSNNTGSDPYDCDPSKPLKNYVIFPKVVMDLNKEWPNLSGKNYDFWAYEWKQHGTCCLNNFNLATLYFSKALNIKTKIDLVAILAAGSIVPGKTTAINKGLVEAEIKKHTNKTPELVCYLDPHQQSQPYLLEIRLCLDNKGVNYIDCPARPSSNCPAMIYWPA